MRRRRDVPADLQAGKWWVGVDQTREVNNGAGKGEGEEHCSLRSEG